MEFYLPKMMFVALLLVVVGICGGPVVLAQTHHVVGGDGGWSSLSPGGVFRVGDKLWFTHLTNEESIVELQSLEEFESCNLANPIRMYTDSRTPVALEKEGVRYFTSGNPENCKNGLKLPVSINSPEYQPEFDITPPEYQPEFEPEPPFEPEPKPEPPVKPQPEPAFVTPPPPARPSASAFLNELSFVLFVGLALCFMGF